LPWKLLCNELHHLALCLITSLFDQSRMVVLGQMVTQKTKSRHMNIAVLKELEDIGIIPCHLGSCDAAKGFTLTHVKMLAAKRDERSVYTGVKTARLYLRNTNQYTNKELARIAT